ncbi:DUF5702 domain-containing protein [Lachnospiraceae bacterium 46-15]
MKRYRYRGTITVFLSLVSVLFLSLVCTMVESARLQGAKAWAVAVTDMGIFSVFGEYNTEILEKYDVLFLDGSYGGGNFEEERIAMRMREFMKYNANPAEGMKLIKGRNLFPMAIEKCEVSGYTLATDEDGAAFYQQVVQNVKENLGTELLLKYQEARKEAKRQQEAADIYEKKDGIDWDNLEGLEQQQKDLEKEEAKEKGGEEAAEDIQPAKSVENPLDAIKKIKKLGLLGMVVKDASGVSGKSVKEQEMVSGRKRKKGNLSVEKKNTGAAADVIFQGYLLDHFGTWRKPCKDGALEYQMEYILMGKDSDEANLKAVVNRLLLMREGVNLLYAASDTKMRSQAGSLAVSIAGAAPVPGLVQALEAVLLLAWAYGESLLDVRTLMSGGKVPPTKDASTWKLSLVKLAQVTELLEECDSGGGSGQDYEDYLRILMLTGGKKRYPLRALDMMEQELRGQADNWVVKAEIVVSWKFPAVFLRIPQVFMGVSKRLPGYEVKGSFGY